MIIGKQIIGHHKSAAGMEHFSSMNPANGELLAHKIYIATPVEVHLAAEKSFEAFQVYRKTSSAEKAKFLETIADEILEIGDFLITICSDETGLAAPRLIGERARTVNQLRMFAALVIEGSWVDARIDTALPERTPVPKPDLRYMQIPIGPVLVFGASNFPFAYSVAGGDTASALAAGCPVIVKAHPAHPATSALVGEAIQNAAIKTGMPDGVFSLLFDDGINIGTQLAVHPKIKAIGFTGSFKGGKALYDAACSRKEPIPVYAEMGSTNPVFILPGAMQQRTKDIAASFSGSVALGVGQFCTNPGMLVYETETNNFIDKLKEEFEKTSGAVMLTSNISNAYKTGIEHHLNANGVEQLATGLADNLLNGGQPVLLKTNSSVLKANPELSEELFGPTSILIEAGSKEEMMNIANNLVGHLTATVHGTAEDLSDNQQLLDILEQKVGRLIINGYPTGVEVCPSMVHSGPFPASTDSRSTSVGTAAIYRFTRPVCYQSMPQHLLPEVLKNENSSGILRMINGSRTNKSVEI